MQQRGRSWLSSGRLHATKRQELVEQRQAACSKEAGTGSAKTIKTFWSGSKEAGSARRCSDESSSESARAAVAATTGAKVQEQWQQQQQQQQQLLPVMRSMATRLSPLCQGMMMSAYLRAHEDT
eukprot:1156630-Pelagomonas_calceolata.AAC.1